MLSLHANLVSFRSGPKRRRGGIGRRAGLKIRCYYLATSDLALHISERLRTKTTISDAQNVNIASTPALCGCFSHFAFELRC
jgi:hypothetical protein